ncbi:MAG TPA: anaerobic ribonucleoside-triphosphate reductase activating protein [Candidatus Parcubacteria bacterium]|nr:anaerobic ribonucleoside-triphosphate reductase activating protein [Candidatus Parcubacteria bacterium]
MNFGGLQKLTLIDFPGRVAATLFFSGCNFRCPWCYSSELVLPEKIKNQPKIPEKEVFDFLKKRRGLLEGVVFCGGEPTMHKELPSLAKKIKKMGFLLKLDTNGSNPKMLRELVEKNLLDYVAMDIKAPKEKYSQITGGKAELKKIEQSIDFLILGKVDYEFRSTIVPGLHSEKDIIEMARWIKGAKRYFLQNFLPEKTLKPEFEKVKPYPEEFLLRIQKTISPLFEVCQVR